MVWIGNSPLYGENKSADAVLTECGAEQLLNDTSQFLLCQIDQIQMN
jgi:hypothetical protein